MDLLVWSLTRRLAWLVFGTLGVVSGLVVHDLVRHRSAAFTLVAAAVAACLAVAALVTMGSARRFFGKLPGEVARGAHPYRDDPRPGADDEVQRSQATRVAVAAMAALALAGAFVVAAAASR